MPDSEVRVSFTSTADTAGAEQIIQANRQVADSARELAAVQKQVAAVQNEELQIAKMRAEAAGDTQAAAAIQEEIALKREVARLQQTLGIAEHEAIPIAQEKIELEKAILAEKQRQAQAAEALANRERANQQAAAAAQQAAIARERATQQAAQQAAAAAAQASMARASQHAQGLQAVSGFLDPLLQGGGLPGLSSLAGGFAGVTVAAGAAGMAIKASLDAAAESEMSVLGLNTALANTGQYSKEASEGIQELTSKLEGKTNIADETWNAAAATLLKFGVQVDELPERMQMVEDIAARMGGNVEGAADLIGRALNGNGRALTQFGIHLEQGASKAETLAALSKLAASGAGELENAAQTQDGSWKKLKISTGNVLENFGKLLDSGGQVSNAISTVASGIGWVADGIDTMSKKGISIGLLLNPMAALGDGVKLAKTLFGAATPEVDKFAEKSKKAKAEAEATKASLQKEADAAKAVAEKTANAANEVERLSTNLNKQNKSAAEAAGALDQFIEAQKELALASIDTAEQTGEISPAEASAARAKVNANAERNRIEREMAEQKAAMTREQETAAKLREQMPFIGPTDKDKAEKAAHPERFEGERGQAFAEKEKKAKALQDQIDELEASAAMREKKIATLGISRETVSVREKGEEAKNEKTVKAQGLGQQKLDIETEIKALEVKKDNQTEASPEWKATVDKIVALKKKLVDLSGAEKALQGAVSDVDRRAMEVDKSAIDQAGKKEKDAAQQKADKPKEKEQERLRGLQAEGRELISQAQGEARSPEKLAAVKKAADSMNSAHSEEEMVRALESLAAALEEGNTRRNNHYTELVNRVRALEGKVTRGGAN